MQRASVPVLIATAASIASISVLSTSPAAAQQQGNMGGGFIEFLFGDRPQQQMAPGQPGYAQPQAYGQPQPGPRGQRYARQPQYQQQPVYAEPPRQYIMPQAQPLATYPEPQPYQQPLLAPQPSGYPQQQQAVLAPPAEPMHQPADPKYLRQVVAYNGPEKPGTIVINTPERLLYLVQEGGTAMRYGIGVGRPGFSWAGEHKITDKKEWPDWRPPDEMIKRQPYLPRHMPGGPNNPLGARAMYLGSTLYRIHGSNEPWTIGQAVSSGCIRMRNEDVVDLYNRVSVGTKVVVI